MCHAPPQRAINARVTPALSILMTGCQRHSVHHGSGGRSNQGKPRNILMATKMNETYDEAFFSENRNEFAVWAWQSKQH